MSEETAQQLTEMMTERRRGGNRPPGSRSAASTFAGKTGTAEIDVEAGINQAWFIGFAPADDPQIAVAATVERCQGCIGGEVAGADRDRRDGGPAGRAEVAQAGSEEGSVDRRPLHADLARLGSGGMADVWLADGHGARPQGRDQVPARPLRAGQASSSSASAARRSPPPACSTRTWSASSTAASSTDTYYIAMEYVEGASLKDLIERRHERRGRGRVHPPDPRRRPLRPRRRDRPPRPEAAERPDRRRGPRPGRRLRDRPRRSLRHHPDRLGDGHRPVPLARAGPGPGGRPPRRTSTRSA